MSGVRWVLSPVDFRAHVLPETADGSLGVWIARCGHGIPAEAGVDPIPRSAACPSCALVTAAGFDWFGTGPLKAPAGRRWALLAARSAPAGPEHPAGPAGGP